MAPWDDGTVRLSGRDKQVWDLLLDCLLAGCFDCVARVFDPEKYQAEPQDSPSVVIVNLLGVEVGCSQSD